ncbi:hypothetical protein GGR57DRAFT_499141 [Xylariaceae sp. FL1272]|nr:hypothetical protein GGR57DRAFT_499141 [Xylariaceae sp. FL1272]
MSAKEKDGEVWMPGMPLGRGANHDKAFQVRIKRAYRKVGSGTFDDPMIMWVESPNEVLAAKAEPIETIVRTKLKEYNLAYAWIA